MQEVRGYNPMDDAKTGKVDLTDLTAEFDKDPTFAEVLNKGEAKTSQQAGQDTRLEMSRAGFFAQEVANAEARQKPEIEELPPEALIPIKTFETVNPHSDDDVDLYLTDISESILSDPSVQNEISKSGPKAVYLRQSSSDKLGDNPLFYLMRGTESGAVVKLMKLKMDRKQKEQEPFSGKMLKELSDIDKAVRTVEAGLSKSNKDEIKKMVEISQNNPEMAKSAIEGFLMKQTAKELPVAASLQPSPERSLSLLGLKGESVKDVVASCVQEAFKKNKEALGVIISKARSLAREGIGAGSGSNKTQTLTTENISLMVAEALMKDASTGDRINDTIKRAQNGKIAPENADVVLQAQVISEIRKISASSSHAEKIIGRAMTQQAA
ncbi:MAG: hypothetical protein ABIH21_04315 [Patescibacteria group bacterium]